MSSPRTIVDAPLDKLRRLRELQEAVADQRRTDLAEVRRDLLEQCPHPLALAQRMDPRVESTPAIELISRRWVETLRTHDGRCTTSLGPQQGKALALDTPIATPAGWTTLGALRVGDEVFDRRGVPCRVTALSPTWTGRPCFAVRTGDGEAIVADVEHEWVARPRPSRPERTVTTRELGRGTGKNMQIMGPAGLDLPDAALPLDPYVLGVWLGDGDSDGPALTCADPEVLERVRDAGVPVRPGSTPLRWNMRPEPLQGMSRARHGTVRPALVALGVLRNKHVPTVYMRGSEKQRLALLQGLVDSDGYVNDDGQVEFCSTNRRLAEDVRLLVYTLGAKATLTEGRATIDGRDCGPKYRVRFYRSDAAHLPRKAARCRDSSVARTRYTWAEPCSSVPVRCIEVDSPDHTYLAGHSLLPTHNSQLSRWLVFWALLDDPDRRVVFASHSMLLARTSGRLIRSLVAQYGRPFGLWLDQSHHDAADWQLAGYLGGCLSASIESTLTGRPSDVMMLDDLLSGEAQALSPTIRARVETWWESTARVRMAPGAPAISIGTRWSEDDILSRFIAEGWERINIPALADGQTLDSVDGLEGARTVNGYLISTRGTTEVDWQVKRREEGERAWHALEQGNPSPPEGGVFRRAWFDDHRVAPSEVPPLVEVAVGVDPADTGTGDEAGVLVAGRAGNGHLYVLADYSGMLSQAQWARTAVRAWLEQGAAKIVLERNLGVRSSIPDAWSLLSRQASALQRSDGDVARAVTRLTVAGDSAAAEAEQLVEVAEHVDDVLSRPSSGPRVEVVTPKQSKLVRAQSITGLFETGRAHVVGKLAELEHECVTWVPTSRFSPARVDTLAHLLTRLDTSRTPAQLSSPAGAARVPSRSGASPRRRAF